jgi:hypothetical protein
VCHSSDLDNSYFYIPRQLSWKPIILFVTMGVTTRSKRKLTDEEPSKVETDIEVVWEESLINAQLAEKARAKKEKKRRIQSWEQNHPPFEMLVPEVLRLVFLYLDSVRDIYNLSKCSKYIRQAISPEVVIRSAVFNGGKTWSSMSQVMDLVQKRAIQVPSTFRLLRLVNGKLCERLEDCYAYNLVTKTPEDVSRASGRPFGLCICPACVKGVSSPMIRVGSFALYHKRVVKEDWSRLLCQPHIEASTEEPVGPLLLGKTIRQIDRSYWTKLTQEQALDEILSKIDEKRAPEDEARAKVFVDAYQTAVGQYDTFEAAKLQVHIDKRDAAIATRASKKLQLARPVYARIEALLDDFDHKEIALQCDWDSYGICRFHFGPSHEILGPLLSGPSSASQKRIIKAVQEVRDTYDLLTEKGFVSTEANFLSFLVNRRLPFERAICQLSKSFSSNELLKRRHGWNARFRADREFIELVKTGCTIEAFVLLFDKADLKAAFVLAMAGSRRRMISRRNLSTLARREWDQIRATTLIRSWSLYQDLFDRARRAYATVARNASDYLRVEATQEFLAETGPPTHRPNQRYTRQHAVDTMFDSAYGSSYLEDRQFGALRMAHRRLFENPQNFTHHITGEMLGLI